jgi:hypothetical protein
MPAGKRLISSRCDVCDISVGYRFLNGDLTRGRRLDNPLDREPQPDGVPTPGALSRLSLTPCRSLSALVRVNPTPLPRCLRE